MFACAAAGNLSIFSFKFLGCGDRLFLARGEFYVGFVFRHWFTKVWFDAQKVGLCFLYHSSLGDGFELLDQLLATIIANLRRRGLTPLDDGDACRAPQNPF